MRYVVLFIIYCVALTTELKTEVHCVRFLLINRTLINIITTVSFYRII